VERSRVERAQPSVMEKVAAVFESYWARFMARVFKAAGIPACAVWSDSNEEERRGALRDLGSGALNVVFSVDLFNEGVDVPAVDTVLFCAPPTVRRYSFSSLGAASVGAMARRSVPCWTSSGTTAGSFGSIVDSGRF
jgi:predicted helicase